MMIPTNMKDPDISRPSNSPTWIRTRNQAVNSRLLCQLSYKGMNWWRGVELNHLPEAYETSVQPLHFPTMMA